MITLESTTPRRAPPRALPPGPGPAPRNSFTKSTRSHRLRRHRTIRNDLPAGPGSTDRHSTNEHQPVMVPLPAAPVNASPVPGLTSIHSNPERGPYGRSSYRGNCGGHLIRDLVQYHGAKRVLDPMTGSGTCTDVCRELGVECVSFDLKAGDDAAEAESYADKGLFDFVWLHPPYWQMVTYNTDERCLSQAPTLEDFLTRMGDVLEHCKSVLNPGGVICVLIGAYSHQGRYMPLAPLTLTEAIGRGLWPACTEIVRFQHGNTSSRRAYRSSFIPGLHDTCMVFEAA